MKKLAVVAFGGNALLRSGQKGTIEEQEANVFESCTHLFELVKNDYNIVIGHGNGPQVGNVMLQHSAGEKMYGIPAQPLDICVAETQGSIGYMIQQQMKNVLNKKGYQRDVLALITRVYVDKNDPAFQNPTKPVGPYYTKEEAERFMVNSNAKFAEDSRGRGWRKAVASPSPLHIDNVETIKMMADNGVIVITVGGGGIPVYSLDENTVEGIDAVIDKDSASSKLATEIKADEFYILTDIPKVFIHFNTPEQKALDIVTVSEAEKYLAEGHFAEGSMAPKMRAAVRFIKNGGKKCIITESSQLQVPDAGTQIVRD
ncbi:MAG: carbamate kinase [Bacteroidales bacterium]|jgi:carbamate kinase|nr:carbamate kinase [Bacteroidales bacterium]